VRPRALAAFALAAFALAAAACDRDPAAAVPGAGARPVKVARGQIAPRVLLTGELVAETAVDLTVPQTESWQLTIRWLVEDGAVVAAGDRVLEFDNSQFTNGLEQKRLAATEAASVLRSFEDVSALSLAVKEHELRQHRIALDKATLLASVPADLISERTAQERRLAKARAEVAVENADVALRAERRATALELQVKRIELDKATRAIEAAERTIDELVVNAPRDGVVSIGNHPWEERRFQIGDVVQPGFKIATLPDYSRPMEVRAELSDVDDGRVSVGMKGTCTLDAYPGEALACTVAELSPVARNKQRESLRRAFSVKLTLARTDPERMRPGMSVEVDLAGPVVAGALVVPRGAVVLAERTSVRLADGGLREVTLGACDAQRCAIERGVAEGEAVMEGAP
jgi:multidrug resistance efflux pump